MDSDPMLQKPGDPAARTLFAALDAMPSAMIAVTAAGTINYVNPEAVRAFGYPADELIGRPAETVIPFADAGPRISGNGRSLAGRRRDGSTFPVEISLTTLPTDDGSWTLAGVVDISERRAAEDKVRALSQAHLALAELNAAILQVESPQQLYDAACQVIGGTSPYAAGWVGLRNASGEHAPETAAPWQQWVADNEITSAVSLPFRCDGRPVAAFTVYADRPALLDEEFVSVLETMADNVSVALDRLTARERMLAIDSQRVELLGRLVAAQEEERVRIAGDVHDHSIQTLAALDLRLGLHRIQVLRLAPELIASVDVLQAGLADVIDGLRHLLFDLEAADSDVALVDQLGDALDHVFEQSDLHHTLEVVPGSGGMSGAEYADLVPDIRGQAVRIFKEALANVRRHAEASTVRVTVTPDEQGVEIMVTDDGVGPTVDVADLRSSPGHRGLDGMRDRAAVAGGWCRIERADGLTVLRFWLPRTHADAPTS